MCLWDFGAVGLVAASLSPLRRGAGWYFVLLLNMISFASPWPRRTASDDMLGRCRGDEDGIEPGARQYLKRALAGEPGIWGGWFRSEDGQSQWNGRKLGGTALVATEIGQHVRAVHAASSGMVGVSAVELDRRGVFLDYVVCLLATRWARLHVRWALGCRRVPRTAVSCPGACSRA